MTSSPPGRLLDATHKYMYVFLLAGCEVTLSAIVIALGNFLCIKRKQEEPEAKLEMAATAAEKGSFRDEIDSPQETREAEERGKHNGKADNLNAGGEENTEASL